jgi:hypothetical protein
MFRIIIASALLLSSGAAAQMVGDIDASGMTLEQFNESTLDRFGRPTFGLRAQREPELRRLRKMQGRPILEGKISIYDLSDDEIDVLFDAWDEDDSEDTE